MEALEACHKTLEEIRRTIDAADVSRSGELLEAIREAERVFVGGAGRSGLMARSFAQRLMQTGAETHVAGETTTPDIHKGDLLLVVSGSGQTGGPLSYAQIARRVGAHVAAVTAAAASPLAKVAHIVIILPAPTPKAPETESFPKSIQPMGTLFEQSALVYLDALIVILMQERGIAEAEMLKRLSRLE